jgi:hypothetical protein
MLSSSVGVDASSEALWRGVDGLGSRVGRSVMHTDGPTSAVELSTVPTESCAPVVLSSVFVTV